MERITLEDKDQFDAIGRKLIREGASIHARARAVLEVGLVIQRKGWCQGDLAQDESEQGVYFEAPEACLWCMSGAVSAAYSWMFRDGYEYARAIVVSRALTILYDAAVEVSERDSVGTVASWNDWHDRTHEQAIEAFKVSIGRAA